jgi:hypothetical protein
MIRINDRFINLKLFIIMNLKDLIKIIKVY